MTVYQIVKDFQHTTTGTRNSNLNYSFILFFMTVLHEIGVDIYLHRQESDKRMSFWKVHCRERGRRAHFLPLPLYYGYGQNDFKFQTPVHTIVELNSESLPFLPHHVCFPAEKESGFTGWLSVITERRTRIVQDMLSGRGCLRHVRRNGLFRCRSESRPAEC